MPVPDGSIAIVTSRLAPAGRAPAPGAGPASEPRCASAASIGTMAERTFVKFTFFKLDPAWQRRERGGAGAG